MTRPDPDALLDALDPDQRRVAVQVQGPLAVLAGAGTGKTRAITYRIAHAAAVGAVDPQAVLALTFTTKAAAEMRVRLRDLGVPGVQARTFHSAALRQLRYFWPAAVGGRVPDLVDHKASLVAAACARTGTTIDRTAVRDLAAEIEWSKVSMVGADSYAHEVRRLGREVPAGLSAQQMVDVMDAYETAKEERGVIDFEDVLLLMSGILEEREDVARHVRSQYRSFVVDEYQDVSTVQQHLLDLWLGGRHDICVVGDVAQTIYSFAGASPRHLVEFPSRHPGARVVELTRDYRSTPQVVAVANRIMQGAGSSRAGRSGGARGGAMAGAVHLVSQRPSGAAVSFRTWADDAVEADGVAERITALIAEGRPASSIAVLYRTNSQSEAVEHALSSRGIGVVLHGGARFFDRDEIRRAVLLLRRASAGLPGPDVEPTTPTDAPEDGGTASALVTLVEDVVTSVGWTSTAPAAAGAVRERWDNLNALVELARSRPGLSPAAFLAELDERALAQAAPTVDGVTLSTLHAAKGLEWDVVFLIGASEGLLPISLATTPAAREEERRLLYVGVTRARDLLEISWARGRSGGRGGRRRSGLLDGVWPEEEGASDAGRSGGATARTGASRRARSRDEARAFEEEHDAEVLALYEDLREWRKGVASEAGVPAFAIFTDRTLRDIAVGRPRTLRQLRTVRGVGEVKLERFGGDVLAVIRRHRGE